MIIKLVLLSLSTILTLVMIVGLRKGKAYLALVENLNSKDYPLKEFYIIGFYLNTTALFRLRGKLARNLKHSAKLAYDDIYYEYYAALSWAQFLSLSVIICAFGFALSSLLEGGAALLICGVVVLAVLALWNLSMSKMKETVAKRRSSCEYEFPNMVSKLSLLINSGMVLRDAWHLVSYGSEGPLYELMQKACINMDNGDSDSVAIFKFGVLSDSPDIKKFTSSLIQGLEKGNSELSDFLLEQTSELWAHKRQLALQKGEVAAGKLIIPLGLMFGGIIMIIISAAMQSMIF